MLTFRTAILGTLFCACASGLTQAAIGFGQTDTFQDGLLANWAGGDALSVLTGGPAGSADNYLSLTSTGGTGAGSRLATFNTTQWAGNYQGAGVTHVALDLYSPVGNPALAIRVALFGPGGGIWTTTDALALSLPADGAWHHALFSLAQADLTQVSGTDTYASTIAGATRLMVRHNDGTATSGGTIVAATLGIDNVQAVPEPAALGLLALSAVAMCRRRS